MCVHVIPTCMSGVVFASVIGCAGGRERQSPTTGCAFDPLSTGLVTTPLPSGVSPLGLRGPDPATWPGWADSPVGGMLLGARSSSVVPMRGGGGGDTRSLCVRESEVASGGARVEVGCVPPDAVCASSGPRATAGTLLCWWCWEMRDW